MTKRSLICIFLFAFLIVSCAGCSSITEGDISGLVQGVLDNITSTEDTAEDTTVAAVSDSVQEDDSVSESADYSDTDYEESDTTAEEPVPEDTDGMDIAEDGNMAGDPSENSTYTDATEEDTDVSAEDTTEDETADEDTGWSAADFISSWEGTTWRIVDYAYSNVEGLTEDEVDIDMDYEVYFGDHGNDDGSQIVIGDDLSYIATFTEESLRSTYMVDLGSWWNGEEEVMLVDQAGVSGLGAQFFVGDHGSLWLIYDGVFFEAEMFS